MVKCPWSAGSSKSVKSPPFQKRLLTNFSMRKNRLFKGKYSKISYLTQPKYPKSRNTVLRRFVHFNKNCLSPECAFNRLFQKLSSAPTKQWTRERAKNYEILLLVTLTSVLTRMSMPDWASLILGLGVDWYINLKFSRWRDIRRSNDSVCRQLTLKNM